jgi:predicted metalloprotease with PDZ domain
MKSPLIIIFLSLFFLRSFSQQNGDYHFTMDLVNVNQDKIVVELLTPVIAQDEIVYHIPKTVPGTYSVDNYGRYIEGLAAFDQKGNPLMVSKVDTNSWKISHAKALYKIKYKVNDTFDDRDSASKKVFEPTGSNIQKDTNYVINTHCFLGYFEGMKQKTYHLTVLHPANFYGSTSMTDEDKSNTVDQFTTVNYNRIVDNPIMYDIPDTATIRIGKTEILISVYSPNKKVSAAFIADKFNVMLQDIAKYLGGTLPVNKYSFLLYLTDHGGVSGASGALEHSYASMYFLPEGEPDKIIQFFIDNAAHEFFHILTPLSIHSEEIQYFDFNNPKMSEHLWLYEGTTEYHAHLVQEKYGLISRDAFLNVMGKKITVSRQNYNDTLPFTVMSANCLVEYADQYDNVYEKGALIAMCLDIRLRQLSNGKYGILNLIFDLSNKYGKDKPFKDDELFDEIGKLTYPEIKQFLLTYVSGNKPLPLEETFKSVGVQFVPEVETKDSIFSLGGIGLSLNPETGKIVIKNASGMNDLGKEMGYHVNDLFEMVNGKDVTTVSEFNKAMGEIFKSPKTGDTLTVVVSRKNDAGSLEKITLSATMRKTVVRKFNQLSFIPNPDAGQLALQNSWLNTN